MKLVLIRHGEPTYEEIKDYPHQGIGLGKLTEAGIRQAEKVSKDKRLKGATLIISSPYTRALQTASVISRNLNLPLVVETFLHEWMPDVDFTGKSTRGAYTEYRRFLGKESEHKSINWETYDALKKRTHESLVSYVKKHKKVIVVAHGVVISTFTHFDDMLDFCEIREVDFEIKK